MTLRLLPADGEAMATGRVDYAGAITVTGSLMLAVYAIVNGNEQGWGSAQTLGMLGAAVALMLIFLVIESRIGGLAGPSEVLASQTVRDLTAGSGIAFEDAGEHELKGVPERWHLYRVTE